MSTSMMRIATSWCALNILAWAILDCDGIDQKKLEVMRVTHDSDCIVTCSHRGTPWSAYAPGQGCTCIYFHAAEAGVPDEAPPLR